MDLSPSQILQVWFKRKLEYSCLSGWFYARFILPWRGSCQAHGWEQSPQKNGCQIRGDLILTSAFCSTCDCEGKKKPLKIQVVQANKTNLTLKCFVYKISKSLPEERSKFDIYWDNNNICCDRKQKYKSVLLAENSPKLTGLRKIIWFWFCSILSLQLTQVPVRGTVLCKEDYGCDINLDHHLMNIPAWKGLQEKWRGNFGEDLESQDKGE